MNRLLPAPGPPDALEGYPTRVLGGGESIDGEGWFIVERSGSGRSDAMQQQRDGLARLQERLLAAIRALERENALLRVQLERYRGYPPVEEQERECADARALEEERGIAFNRMPQDVYPGKPYVTQLELIRRSVTRYSRQNISRLTREEKAVPAIPIADRVLLAPSGVRVLLERETAATADVSPRRRPGGPRTNRAERL